MEYTKKRQEFLKLQGRHARLIDAHILLLRHNVYLQETIDDLEKQVKELRDVILEKTANIEL